MSRRGWVLAALLLVLLAAPAAAQKTWDEVVLRPEALGGGLWMVRGVGGNLLLCTGADGALLVDAQFSPLGGRIRALADSLGRTVTGASAPSLRFVVNTHYHDDHVDGDAAMAAAGATIVAHEAVRARVSVTAFNSTFAETARAIPPAGRPAITFTDSLTFHLDGHDLRVVHVPPAHTDGDAYVWIPDADVLHTGDLFFNGDYPVVDVAGGGRLDGMIRAADRLLALAGPHTRIVPGHGPLADRAALRRYRDMLVLARERLSGLVRAGRTLAELQAAKPLADLDPIWGNGYMKPNDFLACIYSDLVRRPRTGKPAR